MCARPPGPGGGRGARTGLLRATRGETGPDLRPRATWHGLVGLGVVRGHVVLPLPPQRCAAGEEGQKLEEETGAQGPQVRAAVRGDCRSQEETCVTPASPCFGQLGEAGAQRRYLGEGE